MVFNFHLVALEFGLSPEVHFAEHFCYSPTVKERALNTASLSNFLPGCVLRKDVRVVLGCSILACIFFVNFSNPPRGEIGASSLILIS